ncbi:MAG TPA: site-2 protease family protein [Jatrophihabitantaceae bacterium]|jgi:membrane-associated protease RseP (regulator of RpoE activity)
MLYALGVLIFAVGLLISIALHEVGHMVPAKKFGVKVTQYMVGFGPTVWSRKKGDTEYGIKGIPLGGYIRMIGMVPPPRADGKQSRWPRRLSTAIEDFRHVSRAEVEPGDEERQFYRLTPGKKMIVMLGGPCMNLIIYLILTTILLLTMGLPSSEATTQVGSVSKCLAPATATQAQIKACTAKNTPAALAGFKAGDRIVAVNGTKITSWDQLISLVEPAVGKKLDFTVLRKGADVALNATPVRNLKCANDTCSHTKEAGFLGIAPVERDYFATQSITDVPGQIVSQIAVGGRAIGSYPSKLHSLWQTIFDGKPRDPQGAVGVVGISRIGGQIADSHRIGWEDKLYSLIGLLASVNLLLFFFNLLPLLPLDGGHVAGALVEAVKRGRARLRARAERRRDPTAPAATRPQIFVDTAQMLPVMYAVASVLIVITLLTLYADIVKPINIG